jgi:hypothetical protein
MGDQLVFASWVNVPLADPEIESVEFRIGTRRSCRAGAAPGPSAGAAINSEAATRTVRMFPYVIARDREQRTNVIAVTRNDVSTN